MANTTTAAKAPPIGMDGTDTRASNSVVDATRIASH